jgi:branched-chain amino acid transport system substrate-binding protein
MAGPGLLRMLVLGMALAVLPPAGGAQTPGVTATEIKIGNTSPYSGPASAYGTIGKAIGAYLRKINDEGGIGGRRIAYISYDDSYGAPTSLEVVRKLVEQDQVALLVQTLGSPADAAVSRYVSQQKVPHLVAASGASRWNDPKSFPWTMGWQPSYRTEGRIYGQYLLKHQPDAKIGILYQNDDYGKDYRRGLLEGLGEAARRMVVLEQSYEVTDTAIDSQIVNLKNSGATVFYNATAPRPAVQAIRKAHDIGWRPTHLLNSVSSSLTAVLKPAGLDASTGLVTVLYQKQLTDPQWKTDQGYLDWLAWMQKYYPEGALDDQANAHGYLVAQTLVHVLKQCGNDLSRANIMRQAAGIRGLALPLLLPGITINTSPTDYAPIEHGQLARFDGERWVLFGELYDAGRR